MEMLHFEVASSRMFDVARNVILLWWQMNVSLDGDESSFKMDTDCK